MNAETAEETEEFRLKNHIRHVEREHAVTRDNLRAALAANVEQGRLLGKHVLALEELGAKVDGLNGTFTAIEAERDAARAEVERLKADLHTATSPCLSGACNQCEACVYKFRARAEEAERRAEEAEQTATRLRVGKYSIKDYASRASAAEGRVAALRKALEKVGSHGFDACRCQRFDLCVVAINKMVDEALSAPPVVAKAAETERMSGNSWLGAVVLSAEDVAKVRVCLRGVTDARRLIHARANALVPADEAWLERWTADCREAFDLLDANGPKGGA